MHKKCFFCGSKDILWIKFLTKHETLDDYREGIEYIERHYHIIGGVCDGLCLIYGFGTITKSWGYQIPTTGWSQFLLR